MLGTASFGDRLKSSIPSVLVLMLGSVAAAFAKRLTVGVTHGLRGQLGGSADL